MKRTIIFLLMFIAIPASAQQFRKAIFPHRSVGLCLWNRAKVSNLTPPTTILNEISKYNTNHGYTGTNACTMVDINKKPGGDPDNLPNDQGNGWADWVTVFAGNDAYGWSSTFYSLMNQYPVVIVKTGYPATQYCSSPDSIAAYKHYWNILMNYMKNRPQNFFVITTNYPAATDGHSTRDEYSNLFCFWAKDTLVVPKNVFVCDWFHMLASPVDGYCDPIYASGSEGPGGDHPSNAAVAVVDPIFVQQIFDAAIAYEKVSAITATTYSEPKTNLQFYPNPFNPSTIVDYSLDLDQNISLIVFNSLGQQVTVLFHGKETAGRHQITFNASLLPSGSYFVQLKTETTTITKKVEFVK